MCVFVVKIQRGSKTGHVHLGVENAQEPKYVNLKCPVAYAYNVLNFRGWIKLIYDKITLIYSIKNEFNPTSKVQNIGNGAFYNTQFSIFLTSEVGANSIISKLYYSTVSKMSLIQPLKFRTLKMGCFKMLHL